jgi:hypothetical protein
MEDSYSVVECKQKLGVGDDELKELVRAGTVHVIRQDNQIRIRAADVDALVEQANAPRDFFTEPPDLPEPKIAPGEQEPIALVSEQEMGEGDPTQHEIRSFGGPASIGRTAHDETTLRRGLLQQGGATRCRMFHSRLNDGAMSYMENQINEWADANPDIVIKFMSTTIGMFEGKQQREAHIIVTVFY